MKMINIDLYPAHDRRYLLAHNAATELLKNADIKAFRVSCTHQTGRMIHVESEQGWNPAPLFQEFEDERPFALPPN